MYDQIFLIYDQMYPFFDKIFSNSHCRLRKGFNAEQCLIRMIEYVGNILTTVVMELLF